MFYKIICTIFLLLCNVTGNAQTLKYEVAQKPWIAGLGNHRAILNINKPADAVRLKITWRLHDLHPGKKRFLIINSTIGDTIQNVYRISVSDEQCDIAFCPVTKAGKYYFYYLPYKPDHDAGYYQYGYLPPKMPDAQWIDKNHVTFENLKFYYIHGLGIVSQMSENISIRNVSIAPQPGSGRVIAAFADCFHFSSCYGLVRIENSLCFGSHDDPVNIHGTALRIKKADSNKIIVRFMHDQTWGFNAFEKSDSIEFVNHKTLLPFGTAVVKSSKMISQKEIELELYRPVPKEWQEGECVENISKTPSVIIKNNRFEHTETRGLLVTTRRNVLIEGNTFYRTGMHAILIADDCNSWFESGPVKNVTIRNNKFIDCAYNSATEDYVIFIKPETNNFEKGRYVHSNINITGNEFQVFDSPILFAANVNGLNFNGNHIVQKSLPGFPSGKEPAFSIEHCTGVQILNNNFVCGSLPKEIQIRNMEKKAIKFQPVEEFNLIIK